MGDYVTQIANKALSANKLPGKVDQASKQATEVYQAKQEEKEKYFSDMLPVSDFEYQTLQPYIANASNPEEASYRMATALQYSRMLDKPLFDTFQNLETYHKEWTGQSFLPKTAFKAVTDSYRMGSLTMKLGKLGREWKKTNGEDQNIEKQLDDISREIESLQDNMPRPWYVEALKMGAQSAPFTLQVLGSGFMAGTVAAGTGIAAATATGVTIGSGGTLGPIAAPLTIGMLSQAGGTFGAFFESFRLQEGLEYYRLRKDGVSPEIAGPVSSWSGGLQAAVEVALGNVPGLMKAVSKTGSQAIVSKALKRVGVSNVINRVGRGIYGYGKQALEEGAEEGIQEFIGACASAISKTLQYEGVTALDADKVSLDAMESFKGGFMASLVLGIPGEVIQYKGSAAEAKEIKNMATSLDEKDFLRIAGETEFEMFKGFSAEDKKESLKTIWSNQQKQKEKQVIKEQEKEEKELKEKLSTPMRRLENGKLYTASKVVTDTDSGTRAILKSGDPATGKRYGYIDYTVEDDVIRINQVKIKEGVDPEIRKEMFIDLMKENPDLAIEWETENREELQLLDDLKKEAPTFQEEDNIQWFKDMSPEEWEAQKKLDEQIQKWMPNLDKTKRIGAVALLKARAAALDMTLDKYIEKYHVEGVFGTSKEFDAAQDKRGGVSFKNIEGQAKAIIYAAENADFSTWVHENAHIWQENLTAELKQKTEKAFKVVNGQWTTEQKEAYATMLEMYVMEGKVSNPELKTIFEKFAEWIRNIYKSLVGRVNIKPEIKEVYDELFIKPESPLSGLEKEKKSEKEIPLFQNSSDILFQLNPDEKSSILTDEELEEVGIAYGSKEKYEKALTEALKKFRDISKASKRRRTISPGSGRLKEGRSEIPALYKFKRLNIIGKVVTTADEAAALFSLFRNPRIEIFNILYTSETGEVIGHTAWTSGMPGVARAIDSESWEESIKKIKQTKKNLRASKIWIAHNHPSGDPSPSKEDILVTNNYGAVFQEAFGGQIVVDHNKYSHIDASGVHKYDLPVHRKRFLSDNRILTPQATGPVQTFEAFKDIFKKKNTTVMAGVDNYNKTVAWVYLTKENINNDDFTSLALKWGARAGIILTNNDSDFYKYYLQRTANIGGVNDVILAVIKIDDRTGEIITYDGTGTVNWQSARIAERSEQGNYVYNLINNESNQKILFQSSEDYFKKITDPDTGEKLSKTVPVEKLIPRNNNLSEEKVDSARNKMDAAAIGEGEKRNPIEVVQIEENSYRVLDGNTTLSILKEKGIADAEVKVVNLSMREVDHLPENMAKAKEARVEFEASVNFVAAKYDCLVNIKKDFKKEDRALQKIEEYNGDAGRMVDNLAAEIIFDDNISLSNNIDSLIADFDTWRVKDKITKPQADGFRCILLNIGQSNGNIGEVQIMTKPMWYAKHKGLGHDIYEIVRQLDIVLEKADKNHDQIGYSKWNDYKKELVSLSKKYYDKVFAGNTSLLASSSASSSEIITPVIEMLVRLAAEEIVFEPLRYSLTKVISSLSSQNAISSYSKYVFDTMKPSTNSILPEYTKNNSLGALKQRKDILFHEDIPGASNMMSLFNARKDLEEMVYLSKDWKEFKAQYDEFGKSSENDEWYKTVFNDIKQKYKPKKVKTKSEIADSNFINRMKEDNEIISFLQTLWEEGIDESSIKEIEAAGIESEEEQEELNERVKKASRILREAHPLIHASAISVGKGRTLNPKTIKSIRTMITKAPTDYRILEAVTKGDYESLKQVEADIAERKEIKDPRWLKILEGGTIYDRIRLAKKIENEQIAEKIKTGKIYLDDESKKYLDSLETEIKENNKKIISLENEIKTEQVSLSRKNKEIIDLSKDLLKTKKQYDLAERRIKNFIEKQKEIDTEDTVMRNQLLKDIKRIEKNIEKAKIEAGDDNAKAAVLISKIEVLEKEKARQKKMKDEARALKEVRETMKKLSKGITKKISKTIDIDYADRIWEIQKSLDPNFRSKKTMEQLKKSRDFFERNPEARDQISEKIEKRIYKKPLNEWTLEELKDMYDRVNELKRIGRTKRQLYEAQEMRTRDRIKQGMQDDVLQGEELKKPVGGVKPTKIWDKVRIESLRPDRIVKMLGPVWEEWLQDRVNEAWNKTMRALDKRVSYIKEKLEESELTIDPLDIRIKTKGYTWVGKTLDIEGFKYENGKRPTIQDAMYWYIGMNNDRTRRAILSGNMIPYDTVMAGINMLTEQQKKVADYIQKDLDDNFDRLRKTVRKLYNIDVEPVDFYVPMKRLDISYESRNDEIMIDLAGRSGLTKQYMEKGFIKSRVDISDDRQAPIRTDLLNLWHQSVLSEESFIHQDQLIKRLHAMAEDLHVRRAVQQKYGSSMNKWISKYINDLAKGDIYNAMTGAERLQRTLRNHVVIAYLSYNLLSNLKQLVSVIPFLTDAGPYQIMVAAGEYLKSRAKAVSKGQIINSEWLAEIEDMSPTIKHRSISRDFEELKRSNGKLYNEVINKIGKTGMISLEVIDKVSVAIGWKAVFNKAKSQGMSETEALKLADKSVTRTQPSGRIQDLAQMYRSGDSFKWFTMFTNALNAYWNMAIYDIPQAVKEKHILKATGDITAIALSGAGIAIACGALVGNDDEEKKKKMMSGIFSQFTDSIPIIGSTATSIMNASMGLKTFQGSGVQIFPAGESLRKGVNAITNEDYTKAFEYMIEGSAYAAGLPVAGPKRITKAITKKYPGALIGLKEE